MPSELSPGQYRTFQPQGLNLVLTGIFYKAIDVDGYERGDITLGDLVSNDISTLQADIQRDILNDSAAFSK